MAKAAKTESPADDGVVIVELAASNIKRLKAVAIRPDGAIVQITGANGAGKTSILDCIMYGLGGKDAVGKTVALREGQDEGEITIELDNGMRVLRTFTRAGAGIETKLRVESSDGARYKTPQAVLDALLGELTFDPLAFARDDAKGQVATLKSLVRDFDFEDNADAVKRAYDQRTDENRMRDRESAAMLAITIPRDAPAAAVDTADLARQLSEATAHNQTISDRQRRREEAGTQIEQLLAGAERLRAQAASAEAQAAKLQTALDAAEALPEPIDIAAITARIETASSINTAFDLVQRRTRHREAAGAHEKRSADLSANITRLREAARAAIEQANLPVAGLALGEDSVLFGGLPFVQASAAEQLRVSVAVAMALNPGLRVLRITDGSLLDRESMAMLAEMASAKGYQIWIERVLEDGKVGFTIEDGTIAAINGKRLGGEK